MKASDLPVMVLVIVVPDGEDNSNFSVASTIVDSIGDKGTERLKCDPTTFDDMPEGDTVAIGASSDAGTPAIFVDADADVMFDADIGFKGADVDTVASIMESSSMPLAVSERLRVRTKLLFQRLQPVLQPVLHGGLITPPCFPCGLRVELTDSADCPQIPHSIHDYFFG